MTQSKKGIAFSNPEEVCVLRSKFIRAQSLLLAHHRGGCAALLDINCPVRRRAGCKRVVCHWEALLHTLGRLE